MLKRESPRTPDSTKEAITIAARMRRIISRRRNTPYPATIRSNPLTRVSVLIRVARASTIYVHRTILYKGLTNAVDMGYTIGKNQTFFLTKTIVLMPTPEDKAMIITIILGIFSFPVVALLIIAIRAGRKTKNTPH